MLLAFRVRNFRSVQAEQELLLWRKSRLSPRDDVSGAPVDSDVSAVAGIYGANASGKSNLLAAMDFTRRAVLDSHARWKPEDEIHGLTPFLLAKSRQPESAFEVEVRIDSTRYQYGFECDSVAFRREWLYAYPAGRRQTLFERDAAAADPWYFGRKLVGPNRAAAQVTRPNALFLSAAVGLNHPGLRPIYHWFRSHLAVARPGNRDSRLAYALRRMEAEPEAQLQQRVLALLKAADLGVQGLAIRHRELGASDRARVLRVLQMFAEGEGLPPVNETEVAWDDTSRYVELLHSGGSDTPVPLPFEAESEGTRGLMGLALPIIEALDDGDTLLVDEIEASLHPRIVAEVVRLFSTEATNPNRGQLVFTTHDTALLGDVVLGRPLLERDQVWLVEKDGAGATTLYPLTDFGPRKGESLLRGYLQGRYGAVPLVEDLVRDTKEQKTPHSSHVA